MKGFAYALTGLKTAISTEVNLRTHLFAALLVILSGWYLKLSLIEWVLMALCFGLVITTELLNTAIEYLVDFISPEIHPKAGKIKDISAGAVLIAAITSVVTGLLIFIPKILVLINGNS